MKRFYYGLLLFVPFYFFVASNKKRNDIIYDEIAPGTLNTKIDENYELKEEYTILKSIPKYDTDKYIENRINELEDIITKKIIDNKPINKKYELKPLNVKFKRNPGKEIEYYNRNELLTIMKNLGFRKLNDYNIGMLRRIWLAYNYDQLFWDVHYKTNFPISIIYAYFIMEATFEGVESDLMADYMNPGGIKYTGIGDKINAYDDCYNRWGKPIKCEFAIFRNYYDMVDGWSKVFNQNRYANCRSYNNAPEICKCLYKSGYHTANNWNRRAMLSKEYWKLRASFP